MYQPSITTSSSRGYATPFDDFALPRREAQIKPVNGLLRRLRRERRRRKVGRSYDMALEVGQMIPAGASILDIGCGNGYIAHHLSALRNANVTGIDLQHETEAQIKYRQYDGVSFPVEKESVDAALLCYVLHHTQDLQTVLSELRRVLRRGGMAIIYEDIPDSAWDRMLCSIHDLKWRKRTGPCTFRTRTEWQRVFNLYGFEVVTERSLSRWRNLAYPVKRRCYVVKLKPGRPLDS